MRWLITGGCGFIGRSLIENLIQGGDHQVRVLDNLSVGTRDDLKTVTPFIEIPRDAPLTWSRGDSAPGASVQLVVGDVLDQDLAEKVAEEVDVIVHLAANTGVGPSVEDPRSDCITNVIGTLNMLEGARAHSVPRFVFASSGAPVGECTPPIHEKLPPHPVSPYGASKLAGEGYCSAYFRTFGVATVALRFGNVYGPNSGHKSSVVAKFIRQAVAGETLEVYGDGSQTRDFIHIHDLVSAIKKAVEAPSAGGEVFQIATASETTISELVDLMVPRLEARGVGPVEVVHGPQRVGDVSRNFSDTSKAKRILGWSSGIRLAEGLDSTIEWFLSRETSEGHSSAS